VYNIVKGNIVANYYAQDATTKVVQIIEVIDEFTIKINIKLTRSYLRIRTIFQDNLTSYLLV